jgi:predicted RNase H-like HicB family nuclease
MTRDDLMASQPLLIGGLMRFDVVTEQEIDGRWIADVPTLPGAMAYGATEAEAVAHARDLAQKVVTDRLAHGESVREDQEH